MPVPPDQAEAEKEQEPLEFGEKHEPELPFWMVLWGRFIHIFLWTAYFLLISAAAIGIDLGLHWFEKRSFVENYGLSPIIRWEIELMAYTLATVDCFLFMRRLIQPIVEYTARVIGK